MNIAKLFVLASVCFSISSAQAMHFTFNDCTPNHPLTPEEQVAFTIFREYIHQNGTRLENTGEDGEIYFLSSIPQSELQTLEKSDILSVVPSSVEFSDKKDEFIFNVLATTKLFMHVRVHDNQRFMLPAKFRDLTQDEFKKIYLKFEQRCSATLGNLHLVSGKKDKIRKMVDQNIKKIIEQLGGNPELYNTVDQDKQRKNDLEEELAKILSNDSPNNEANL